MKERMKCLCEFEEDFGLELDLLDVLRVVQFDFSFCYVFKIIEFDIVVFDDEELGVEMKCFLFLYKELFMFDFYEEYELYYCSYYMYCCFDCWKNFFLEYLFNVYIEEWYDFLVVVKRDWGEYIVSICYSFIWYNYC